MAFVLFLIIFVLTASSGWVLRDKDARRERRRGVRAGTGAGHGSRRRRPMSTPPAVRAPAPTAARDRARPSNPARSALPRLRRARLLRAGLPLPVRHPGWRRRSRPTPTPWRNPLSLVPDPFTTSGVRAALRHRLPAVVRQLRRGHAVVTVGRVFLDSLAGYALARMQVPRPGAVFTTILAVMAVPGVVLLIPKFLVLNQLGIYDTYSALILPLLVDAAGVFIMKQFFESRIPVSVEEAARIDGASTFRTFWSVVLPMAAGADHADDPVVPGLVERAAALHRRGADPELFTLTRGRGRPRSGLGSGSQYPLSMAAALLADHPGRRRLRGLPALLRPRRGGRAR